MFRKADNFTVGCDTCGLMISVLKMAQSGNSEISLAGAGLLSALSNSTEGDATSEQGNEYLHNYARFVGEGTDCMEVGK